MVEAGITTVLPGPVTVTPGTVDNETTVVPGPVTVVSIPGKVEREVTVVPGSVMVAKEPEIEVVMVLPGSEMVVRLKISEVTVVPGSVSVLEIRMLLISTETDVTVEAERVMVVRDPEIEVVTVEAGRVVVVEISSVDTTKSAKNQKFENTALTSSGN
jgi:hypothetical protein